MRQIRKRPAIRCERIERDGGKIDRYQFVQRRFPQSLKN